MKSRPTRIATQSVAGGEKTKEQLKEDLRNTREELAIQKWGLKKTLGGMKVLVKELIQKGKEIVGAKAIDEALLKDLEKYKLAIDNVSDQIIITDPDATVLYANNATEKITGYSAEEVVGKKAGKLWGNLMERSFYDNLWRTIKNDKKTFVGEIMNQRKNKQTYSAHISISPILDERGEVGFFVGIEHDITKEKEVDKAKSEFASIASHELRTPLTAIDGLVSMILDGEYGEVNKELMQPLSDVNTSSERLIHLVNDLLNLSRLQAGKLKYTFSETDIKPIVEGVVKMLQVIAEPKGLKLSVPNIDSVTVLADVNKMEQILDNLIGNSLKFTDKGSIVLSTKITENNVIIFITDTGIGIGKEDLGKLFGRFEKLESGLGRAAGTGLGLHISREMARKMRGDVWLEKSEKGVGSTFALSLLKSKTPLAEKVKSDMEIEARVIPDQKAS